jgi:hypothetical protein
MSREGTVRPLQNTGAREARRHLRPESGELDGRQEASGGSRITLPRPPR